MKTLLAATVAVTALMSAPQPAQAQSGDPFLRLLNSMLPNAQMRPSRGGWDDDDDNGRGNWNDDDDDRGGRDDDDDDGRGNDDDD